MLRRKLFHIISTITLLLPSAVFAHEAYVVDKDYFWEQLNSPYNPHALDSLKNTHNIAITVKVIIGVLVLYGINFFLRRTRFGEWLHKFPERYALIGPIIIRATIAAALFFSATSSSFLGPELPLASFGVPSIIKISLFAVSILVAFGLFTELAGVVGIGLFVYAFRTFGTYMLTYTNYLGEFLVLALFGMRKWSFDTKLFGKLSKTRKFYEKYETTIVRILYGFALIVAGITVKLLHPDLTTHVAVEWNLMQFHWLFPSDPLLITLGAGITEIVIGLFIIFGFELRLTVLITLFYITLSLFYFRELVWPHLLLYGISLNLLVQPEIFTLDHLIFEKHRKHTKWWRRPFLPHHPKSKSIS